MTVRFGLLCSMFQAMVRDRSSVKKRKHLRTFLDRVCTDQDYFSAIRLILPSLDRERGSYGLKEPVLAACLVDAMSISKNSEDALRLINWRKGGTRAGANAGNFALIAAEVLQRRQGMTSGGLTIKEVNDALDELSSKESRGDKASILSGLIQKTNTVEMKWILMIILKNLKLGMSEKIIFHEFHPDAEDLFNVTCDLKLVCEKLSDRTQRHKRQDIEVGKAVRPQLAMRVSDVAAAWKKLNGKQVVVECKFDGDRIQIHKNGAGVHYFSRNFLDHSEYGHGMSDIILQNILADRCILDGEMLVWNTSTQRFAEFGSNQEIAKAAREGWESDRQLCYVAFDVLYVGDTSVIHQSLAERHDLLRKIVKPVKGRLEILMPNGGNNCNRSQEEDMWYFLGKPQWSIIAYNMEDVERFFKQTIDNRDEGIVLKDLGSKWEPSDRSGKWLKLKPDYIHAGADLDVLIIGGYFGSGRHGGEVAQFLMGIAKPLGNAAHPKRFMSFCRVGTGLSDDELNSLVAKLKPYFRKNVHPRKAPCFYEVTSNSKERPDVWIESPDKSIILSITSDIRMIKSEVFAAPYSLRFPRINCVAYDKPWHECLDVQSFVDLVHQCNGSMPRGRNDEGSKDYKQVKVPKKRERNVTVVPTHLTQTDVSGIKEETYIFTNMMFYFANISSSYSLDYFHKLVAENGGKFSMNLNDSVTHCIAAEKKGIKYQAATLHGDVIHYSWFLDCCNQKCLLHLQPKYFLFLAESSKLKFQEEMDVFSDYYYLDLDISDIQQIFRNMNGTDDLNAVHYYQKKYCPKEKWCLFQDCCIYFVDVTINVDYKVASEVTLRRIRLEATMHGAEVVSNLSHATHVVACSVLDSTVDFEVIYKCFSSSERNILFGNTLHVIRHQWVEDSFEMGTKLSEDAYNLRPDTFEGFKIEQCNHGQEVPIPNTDHESLIKSTVLIHNNVHHESLKKIASPGEIDQRKRSKPRKPARRTRPRISNRHVKINPDESENNSTSDKKSQPVRDSDFDDEQQHNKRVKGPEMIKNHTDIPDQSKRSGPGNNHRKEIAITKPAQRTQPRISNRRVKINPDESENNSALDKQSQPVRDSDADDEKQHNKRIEEPEMITDHTVIPVSETEECLDAESQGNILFEDYKNPESKAIDEMGKCASQQLKIGLELDPVQAMLFDMVPSLCQKKVETGVPTHHDEKPKAEQEQEPNPDPLKKKKVSYRDIAGQLLKDW